MIFFIYETSKAGSKTITGACEPVRAEKRRLQLFGKLRRLFYINVELRYSDQLAYRTGSAAGMVKIVLAYCEINVILAPKSRE